MRSLIILSLITGFLTGCSGKKKRGVDPNTGLTADEYNSVKAINDSFGDLNQAVDIGTIPRPKTAVPSEKALEMGKLIAAASCQVDGERTPPKHTDHNWDQTHAVSGADCPLKISYEWHFRAHRKFSGCHQDLCTEYVSRMAAGEAVRGRGREPQTQPEENTETHRQRFRHS